MNGRSSPQLLFAVCVASALQNMAAAADEPAQELPLPDIIAEFDIAKGGDVIVLPVTIADRSYPFLLSIANCRTIVDRRLRPLLGQRIEPKGEPADQIESAVDEYPSLLMKIGEFAFTPTEPLICRTFHRHREL